MTSPSPLILIDSDDEFIDSPATVLPGPYADSTSGSDGTEASAEIESVEMDEDSEEEPMEVFPDEPRSPSPSPVIPSPPPPIAQPERANPRRLYQVLSGSGPRTIRAPCKRVPMPRVDPVIASLSRSPQQVSSTARHMADVRKWSWIPETLQEWRLEEGSPRYEVGEASNTAQIDPVTRELPQHTTHLLIARTRKHERRLDSVEEDMDTVTEEVQEAAQDLAWVERNQRVLRTDFGQLERRFDGSVDRIAQVESRMDSMEGMMLELLDKMATIQKSIGDLLRRTQPPQ